MNIFVLDRNPTIAAQMACDKHVVKMILETAQMLCTVARNNGFESTISCDTQQAPLHFVVSQVTSELAMAHRARTCIVCRVYQEIRQSSQVPESY